MVHLDESIPQEVDVDPALDVIRQLLPVLRVSSRQVQVDGPPVIEVCLETFAELEINWLFCVVILQRVEKKCETFRVAW